MPCDTIKTVTVNVKSMRLDVLKQALEAMGHYVYQTGQTLTWGRESYNQQTGELKVTSQASAQKVTQSYVKEGVKGIAKKFDCQFAPNAQKGENHYTLLKRSF